MNSPNEPNKKPPERSPDRFQPKPFIIWFVIIAVIMSLLIFSPGPRENSKKLSVIQVIELAENGEILTLKVKEDSNGGKEWYRLTGRLVPVAQQTGSEEPSSSVQVADDTQSDLPTQKAATEEGVPFVAEGRITEKMYERLVSSMPPEKLKELPASGLFMEIMLSLLPFLLIIALLYFLFVRQLRMAGKGAMSFGKSKARMLTRDRDRATFKDVAGCDEAKEEVSEIVDFLKNPKKFQSIGGRVPKGVLMVGPPGTGKTLLAKAIAGEADVPFFTISGSDFVEMFVGVGAARVRDMFEQGRRNAPCIIFIDEIDAVGRQRGAGLGGGNDEREQTLNSLLVEMDGFDTQEGIIIIAATNRPDVLDQALLRPGRFDRQVMIDMPDLVGREQILKVHVKKIKMDENLDLTRVARSTPGFSGADLANLVNEATLIAARYGKQQVTDADFEEARDKIAYGRERRKLMDDDDKRLTAFHEAGHALVKAIIKDKKTELHKVTILPRGRALGMAMITQTKDVLGKTKNELLNDICMAMGGRIGEEIETGDFSSGAMSDIKVATRIARSMVCDWGMSDLGPVAFGENQEHIFLAREITRNQDYSEETARRIDSEIRRIIDEQYKRAEQLIREQKDALRKIAEALLQYETIEGKHVSEIIEFGEIRSPVINNAPQPSKDDEPAEDNPAAENKQKDDGKDFETGAEPASAPA